MKECERCGVQCRSPTRIQTGTYFGKSIYKEFCSPCAKKTKEEMNQKISVGFDHIKNLDKVGDLQKPESEIIIKICEEKEK